MPTPATFTSYKQFLGVAKETQQGTAVAMTATIPVEKLDFEDKPVFLDDKAMRGSMVESYGKQAGVIKTDFSFSGPVFGDTLGWLLGNILGDLTTTGASAPFTHAFSTLNSGNGQPTSHTFTQYTGTTASTGTRQWPGACLSELTLKWNAESQLFTYDAKGSCWPSIIAAATPTSAPSTVTPIASWRGQLGVGGPATGGTLALNVTDGEIAIKRVVEPVFTTQNAQTPYIIQRGAVSASGKLNFIAKDETPYLNMVNNTQPQLQLIVSNGLTGAAQVQCQVDVQQGAFVTAKYDSGKSAIAYQTTFDAVANTTNAGTSGGFSPLKATLTNAIAAGTYV
ncbi:phage tail tube protein [Amycolatopsis benzoatilytica]|uniref:phage tail tube protein n=1 Tax=Amycolatopsis benzoatilytica TaxID=346045 RepID=UPI00035D7627|nr:phage tail tube protein [Amycolatopsis benzoatilytica]